MASELNQNESTMGIPHQGNPSDLWPDPPDLIFWAEGVGVEKKERGGVDIMTCEPKFTSYYALDKNK